MHQLVLERMKSSEEVEEGKCIKETFKFKKVGFSTPPAHLKIKLLLDLRQKDEKFINCMCQMNLLVFTSPSFAPLPLLGQY